MNETLKTVPEVAKLLQLSDSYVYAKIASGEFPHYKIGGAVRISDAQIEEYLQRSRRGPALVAVKPLKNLRFD